MLLEWHGSVVVLLSVCYDSSLFSSCDSYHRTHSHPRKWPSGKLVLPKIRMFLQHLGRRLKEPFDSIASEPSEFRKSYPMFATDHSESSVTLYFIVFCLMLYLRMIFFFSFRIWADHLICKLLLRLHSSHNFSKSWSWADLKLSETLWSGQRLKESPATILSVVYAQQ